MSDALMKWLFGDATPNHTARVIGIQMLFAFVSLLLLLWVVAGSWDFVGWATITACCASLFGILLGLLFGLPTTQRVELTHTTGLETPPPQSPLPAGEGQAVDHPPPADATATAATPPAPPPPAAPATMTSQAVPYSESTSLEMVADWLTKIIIGLTLTQYRDWGAAFQRLSVEVTANLMGTTRALSICRARFYRAAGPVPGSVQDYCGQFSGGAVPGGALMLTFALLGFLVAYLWMRRYFITEMVVARNDAIEKMRAARDAEVAARRLASQQAEQIQLVRSQAELAQVRAEAAANLNAAQARADAEVARVTHEADLVKEALQRAQAAAEDQQRKDAAASLGRIQAKPDQNDTVTASEVVAIAGRAQQMLPSSDVAQATLADLITELQNAPPAYPDDCWRGLFGEQPCDTGGNICLSAKVDPFPSDPNLFEVKLALDPMDAASPPTRSGQKAIFFLHPTFGIDPRSVAFGSDGRATLPLIAYGAFTVGVLLEDGVKLELNLAEVKDAPELFRIN